MSFDAAIGRIAQIVTLQRQLAQPAAAGGLPAAAAAAASLSGASGDFASALASAQGSAATTAGTGANGTTAASASDPRVTAMIQAANSLVGKPYIVGGGHSGWGPQVGYDCSGFVSAVLHAGGYLTSPQTTVTLPNQPGILSGPGQYVTIYDRAQPGQRGHVIIDIGGQFYESGGMHGSWGGGGGVKRIATPPASYLATFPTILHPAGL